MSDENKLQAVKILLKDDAELYSDDVIAIALAFAKSSILRHVYPFQPERTDFPAVYDDLQVTIAIAMLDKMGAEGESSHSENGISRTWQDADAARAFLKNIPAFVGGVVSASPDSE